MFILSEVEYATYPICQQSFFNGRLPIRYQTGQSLFVLELIRQYSIYTTKNVKSVCLKLCTPFSFSKYIPTLMYLVIIQEDGKVVLSLIGFIQSCMN